MISEKRLIDILPSGTFDGFLKSMPATAPWAEDSPDLASLDALYLYQHSGEKLVAPLMNMFLTDGKLTQAGITACSKMAASLWYDKWTRLYAINKAEYAPLENYNLHEEEDTTPTGTETDTVTFAGTETKELSHEGYDTVQTEGLAADNKAETAVYGFNSSTPSPATEQKVNTDQTITSTPGTTDTEERSFTDRTDTKVKSFEDRNTHRELDRSGNIGTVTAQDMARQELELWQWNFWLQVFEDLDSTICLDCY